MPNGGLHGDSCTKGDHERLREQGREVGCRQAFEQIARLLGEEVYKKLKAENKALKRELEETERKYDTLRDKLSNL